MPSKPKKGKKGKGKKKPEVPLDDIDTTLLSKEKLQEYCVRVNEELWAESQHSDLLRLERDKLVKMAAIADVQLTALKNENRRRQIELLDNDEAHRKNMADARQKVIHLVIEKDVQGLNKRLESIRLKNDENKNHRERVGELTEDIRHMETKLVEMDSLLNDDKVKLQKEHDENKSKIREKNKEVSILIENKREKTMLNTTLELNEKFDKEYNDLDKRKNKDIGERLTNNAKFTYDLSHYYNKILHHNVKVISELKATCQEMKNSTALVAKELGELSKENAELKDNLRASMRSETNLQGSLADSMRDKHELQNTRLGLERGLSVLDHMRWELEALIMLKDKQAQWIQGKMSKAEEEELRRRTRNEEELLAWEYVVAHLHYRHRETDSTLRKIREICLKTHDNWPRSLDALVRSSDDTTLDECHYHLASSLCRRDQLLASARGTLRRRGLRATDLGLRPQTEADLLRIAPLRVLVDEDDLRSHVV